MRRALRQRRFFVALAVLGLVATACKPVAVVQVDSASPTVATHR